MNLTQEMLTSLISGELAFKVYNAQTESWETVNIANPELVSHAGAKASVYQAGHIQLTNDFTSESEVLAPTAKALKQVFDSVGTHVNEKNTHLTLEQIELINQINGLVESVNLLKSEVEALKADNAIS